MKKISHLEKDAGPFPGEGFEATGCQIPRPET
jgi:hypothetical protein